MIRNVDRNSQENTYSCNSPQYQNNLHHFDTVNISIRQSLNMKHGTIVKHEFYYHIC